MESENGFEMGDNAPRFRRRGVVGWVLVGFFGVVFGVLVYFLFVPNVVVVGDRDYLFVPSGCTYRMLVLRLEERGCLRDLGGFKFLAELVGYPERVRAGRYLIYDGMSNFGLLRMLYGGQQEAVKFRFESFRTVGDFALVVEKQLEMRGVDLLVALGDIRLMDSLGFKGKDLGNLFIPNTYEVYWDVSPVVFLRRMRREYDLFWGVERLQKAKVLGLSPFEVGVLASIVEGETYRVDERVRVAGVYLNRLKRGMALQADPTVIFAIGDFSIKRVFKKHLEVDSPYNTYKYTGLPPGPINAPSVSSIDAVLNYERHNYIYFCAKNDNSGYHHFSEFYEQHLRYARDYHSWMNKIDTIGKK